MDRLFVLSIFFLVYIIVIEGLVNQNRSFKIDYKNNQFLKDGQPFQYVSGSLHYFRVPRAYWQDRLRKIRAAGLNTVSTYVEWSRHEPKPGVYDFTADNDLEHFIRLADEEGLLVILRPGPYICAERDLGGYPVWLFHKNPKVQLRTSDPSHTKYVQIWLDTLLPKVENLLYENGGPIIMVQVENEYGSYPICDREYLIWLRDIYVKHVGTKAVLFTTDGPDPKYLKCGPIPGVFATIDFGSGTNSTKAFGYLRKIQPHGPLVNSEFYPGWLTKWGESVSTVKTQSVVQMTRELLQTNVSFNYYVFFGGTNFGFTSGAVTSSPPNLLFQPQITSYDYDAPITEAGYLTEKYFAIKNAIAGILDVPDIKVENSTRISDYGSIPVEPKISLFNLPTGISYNNSKYPRTFEELELYSGFLLYETKLPESFSGTGLLSANNLHDRAILYIDKKPVGAFDRYNSTFSLTISGGSGQHISLLVENQGHINYGLMSDLKGITENVTLDSEVLVDWMHTGYPLQDAPSIINLSSAEGVEPPAFYVGRFQLPEISGDTFVDMSRWGKGIVYVNGHNLGRYWSTKGPQQSLFLPAPFLFVSPVYNNIVIFELEKEDPSRNISFSATPIWSSSSR